LCQAANFDRQALVAAIASTTTNIEYGKAKCTRAFAESQSASRSGTALKSKSETPAAAAGEERFAKRRSRD